MAILIKILILVTIIRLSNSYIDENINYCLSLPWYNNCLLYQVFESPNNLSTYPCVHKNGNLVISIPQHIYIDVRHIRYTFHFGERLMFWNHIETSFRPRYYVDVPYSDLRALICSDKDSEINMTYGNLTVIGKRDCVFNFTHQYTVPLILKNRIQKMRVLQTSRNGIKIYEFYENFTLDMGYVLTGPAHLLLIGMMFSTNTQGTGRHGSLPEENPDLNIEIECPKYLATTQQLPEYLAIDSNELFVHAYNMCQKIDKSGIYNLMLDNEATSWLKYVPIYYDEVSPSFYLIHIKYVASIFLRRIMENIVFLMFPSFDNIAEIISHYTNFDQTIYNSITVNVNPKFLSTCEILLINFKTGSFMIFNTLDQHIRVSQFIAPNSSSVLVYMTMHDKPVNTSNSEYNHNQGRQYMLYNDMTLYKVSCPTVPNTSPADYIDLAFEENGDGTNKPFIFEISKSLGICT